MKLENIKLIHTIIDVPITYNNGEQNYENVFILDSNNNNINGITYACPIYFEKNIIENEKLNKKNIYVENVFLFYSFFYQIAFGHFIEQTLPKINYYLKLKTQINNLKFCIPKKRYNLITDNIIKSLKICEEDILILDNDIIINATNLFYNNYECGDFNTDKIETFNLIREKLLVNENVLFNRNVYLKKNTENIPNNDCYNIGKLRQIINEEQLINILKTLNFEIITLGECDIITKKNLLSNINILITQTGGAMYNLIFSNTPKDIIFLSNNHPLHTDYINNLLPKLNFYTPISMKLFTYNSYIKNCDKTNIMNDPFIVNVDEIVSYCNDKL
jgi:capsular polysaccharide biosynthesis protein